MRQHQYERSVARAGDVSVFMGCSGTAVFTGRLVIESLCNAWSRRPSPRPAAQFGRCQVYAGPPADRDRYRSTSGATEQHKLPRELGASGSLTAVEFPVWSATRNRRIALRHRTADSLGNAPRGGTHHRSFETATVAAHVLRALRMVGLEIPVALVHRGGPVVAAAKGPLSFGSRPSPDVGEGQLDGGLLIRLAANRHRRSDSPHLTMRTV